jgi:hypothetical protein
MDNWIDFILLGFMSLVALSGGVVLFLFFAFTVIGSSIMTYRIAMSDSPVKWPYLGLWAGLETIAYIVLVHLPSTQNPVYFGFAFFFITIFIGVRHDYALKKSKAYFERQAVIDGRIKRRMDTGFIPDHLRDQILLDANSVSKEVEFLTPIIEQRDRIGVILQFSLFGGGFLVFVVFINFTSVDFGLALVAWLIVNGGLYARDSQLRSKYDRLQKEHSISGNYEYEYEGGLQYIIRPDGFGGVEIISIRDKAGGNPFDDATYYPSTNR